MVDTHRRRRLAATTSAAFLLPSFPLLIASPAVAAAAPTPDTVASLRTGIAPTNNGAAPLATAFSCGTHWAAARKCSVLCPTGDDDACPPGQHCYGGTSCSEGGEGGPAPEEALERQRRLERREVERLARRREEDYAPRFVCGGSFAEAEESCGADALLAGGGATYCGTGSSARCPGGTRCYAAVPCPRSTHDETPPLLQAENSSLGLLQNSFLLTEPTLLNSTDLFAMEEDKLSKEEAESGKTLAGSLFTGKSLSTVWASLSSRYGLN